MRTKRISITIPTYSSLFENISVVQIRESLSTLFLDAYQGATQNISTRKSSLSGLGKKLPRFRKFNVKKALRIGVPIFGVILLAVVVWSAFSSQESTQAAQGPEFDIAQPIDSQDLNKTYTFPVMDEDEELTRFTYTLESAELQKQIIVKGQRATSVEGRMFLILDLKLVNDFDQPLSINTRDYVRVVLDGNEGELLAPDIHNDPVEVQAISTKPTRLGLSIDSDVQSVELRVGEIDGEKETIKLDLSNY